MAVHWNSTSLSASAHGADSARAVLTAQVHGIAFDLVDVALEQVLRTIVEGRHDFYEASPELAAVTISDRPQSDNSFAHAGRILRVGGDAGRNALETLDPGLILSAASLIAAGYTLDKERAEREGRTSGGGLVRLSQRERQVADLLVDGASNKVIARALDISVHTAKFHVTAILDKLGARNRADAVSIILREGLVAI